MDTNTFSMIVRAKRIEKGYTQQELAELSKISLRSVQRIEKGEVVPRAYTCKMLSSILELDANHYYLAPEGNTSQHLNYSQKMIITISGAIFIFFGAFAFASQSAGFPETDFEFFMLCIILLFIYTVFTLQLWKQ
jgi:transcriptional regulator with XRE-family HTH domain